MLTPRTCPESLSLIRRITPEPSQIRRVQLAARTMADLQRRLEEFVRNPDPATALNLAGQFSDFVHELTPHHEFRQVMIEDFERDLRAIFPPEQKRQS